MILYLPCRLRAQAADISSFEATLYTPNSDITPAMEDYTFSDGGSTIGEDMVTIPSEHYTYSP